MRCIFKITCDNRWKSINNCQKNDLLHLTVNSNSCSLTLSILSVGYTLSWSVEVKSSFRQQLVRKKISRGNKIYHYLGIDRFKNKQNGFTLRQNSLKWILLKNKYKILVLYVYMCLFIENVSTGNNKISERRDSVRAREQILVAVPADGILFGYSTTHVYRIYLNLLQIGFIFYRTSVSCHCLSSFITWTHIQYTNLIFLSCMKLFTNSHKVTKPV